jgi:hypothetical protein
MFLINHPGPWQYYVNRADNKGLSLMEIKNKYMKEQLLFEQHMSFQMQQQMFLQQQASGGLRKVTDNTITDNTINDFVANDYVENYFV